MKKSYWKQHTHLFCADEYECSSCHSLYSRPYPACPNCKAKTDRTKYDASWVDETAEYDAMTGFENQ